MIRLRFGLPLLAILLCLAPATAQTILTYEEALAWTLENHPLALTARAVEDQGPAAALEARGALDPKLNIDYDRKDFKGTEYWDRGVAELSWQSPYALKVAGGYQRAEGAFLNEEYTYPADGQAYLALKLPLLRGLLLDATRIGLRRGELAVDRQRALADVIRNELRYDLTVRYLNWAYAEEVVDINENIVETLEEYLDNTRSLYRQGDKPAVDTLEAAVYLGQQQQTVRQAQVDAVLARQLLAELYWPLAPTDEPLTPVLTLPVINGTDFLDGQPELRELALQLADVNLQRDLKREALKPELTVGYYILGDGFGLPELPESSPFTEAYKMELTASYPIFNRKARGANQLAELKIAETRAKLDAKRQSLETKAAAYAAAIAAYAEQAVNGAELQQQARALRDAELELFRLGESTLFLINARTQSLLKAELNQVKLLFARGKAVATYRYVLGVGSW